ncbi:MAG: AbrB/MazE/SpoVT family DNA-binding domain-containing protein [Propylenella sp.]
MQSHIRKWGNSLALRIPNAVAREAAVNDGKLVDISVENGRIVVTPVDATPRHSLDDLIAGITEENRHEEMVTSTAIGSEFA